MKIQALNEQVQNHSADALMLYLFQNMSDFSEATQAIDNALKGLLKNLVESGDFTGKLNEVALLYSQDALPTKRIIVVGLGEAEKFNVDNVRQAIATGLLKARSLKAKNVATVQFGQGKLSSEESAQAIVEGALLGLYQYHGQKSSEKPADLPENLTILSPNLEAVQTGIKVGTAFANGTNLARDLTNLPPNICTPAYMAESAEKMAKEVGLSVKVLEKKQMQALKMGALLAVAQGSETPPRFIILEHKPKGAKNPPVVLVGKGVTFDTGGYSLKTVDGMVGMKADMAGGAAVIGAMRTVAELDLPLHVVGLIPAADNMVSGNAYRPQDVVVASNGKSIEIISTDAEGRLLLADALVYAQRYQPAAVINIATLTGAMVVALGGVASGFFTNDDSLAVKLQSAGKTTEERTWQMPIYEEYGKPIESDTADIKNSGGAAAKGGGAGIAAYFLQQFVDYPWAHVDMAGMMSGGVEKPYNPKNSAKGYGARLLAEFVRQWN